MLDIILGAIALGLLWAVMALGVYITYRVLDVADLTVEGTIALGGAVAARFISGGMNPWLATLFALIAGLLGGLCTGLLHTKLKIPALLSGILTMIALYSINLRVMGKSNIPLLRVKNEAGKCVSCGKCKSVCPMNVDMTDNSRRRLNGTECILCFRCVEECPTKALHL